MPDNKASYKTRTPSVDSWYFSVSEYGKVGAVLPRAMTTFLPKGNLSFYSTEANLGAPTCRTPFSDISNPKEEGGCSVAAWQPPVHPWLPTLLIPQQLERRNCRNLAASFQASSFWADLFGFVENAINFVWITSDFHNDSALITHCCGSKRIFIVGSSNNLIVRMLVKRFKFDTV